MKALKIIGITIVVIIAIPLVAALFVKSEYSVEREVTINREKSEVFEYIKYLKNQDNFSKWAKMDPDMKKTFKGTDGTVGFISAWDSQKDDVGKGEQEIKKIIEGERVEFELRFLEPFESVSPAHMSTESVGANQTKVKWGFRGKTPYPMNLMMAFMDFEKMIADDLDVGLKNLKVLLEK